MGKICRSDGILALSAMTVLLNYTKVAAKHAYAVNSTMSDVELASFPLVDSILHKTSF